jgi:hypothetical protein
MITLELEDDEAAALKEAFVEALQDDSEKLEQPEWLHEDPERAAHVRSPVAALCRLLPKNATCGDVCRQHKCRARKAAEGGRYSRSLTWDQIRERNKRRFTRGLRVEAPYVNEPWFGSLDS